MEAIAYSWVGVWASVGRLCKTPDGAEGERGSLNEGWWGSPMRGRGSGGSRWDLALAGASRIATT